MPAVGPEQTRPSFPAPGLVVQLPFWPRVFLGNLWDLIFPRRLPSLELRSAPAPFWPDVFVKRGLPWLGFLESGACHLLASVLLMAVARFLALQPHSVPQPGFARAEVIYYSASEYLPPIDTRVARPAQPAKSDPEFSRQPIISVPAEADNHSQTIVTPPNVRLKHDVPLPNIVAWPEPMKKPGLAIPAAPLTPAADIARIAPQLQDSVVSPPPEVGDAPARAPGALNIGHSPVIAPAPQLAVGEQGAVPGGRSSAVAAAAPQVVPPPPSFSAAGSFEDSLGSGGRVIALNLHPAVGAPPDPPPGNRRGSFAATPEGHAGASGAPGSSVAGTHAGGPGSNENGDSSSKKEASGIPAGLYVGSAPAWARTSAVPADPAGPAAAIRGPNPAATLAGPRAGGAPAGHLQPGNPASLSAPERAVFGARRFYSLTVNMPNMNSAGGSWVIRFAEIRHDSNKHGSEYLASNSPEAELTPPVVTRKVDPGYPLQLMRENVAGTVILFALIHADGTVGNIRVLQSADERLDRFAREAVAQWQFQPATKHGSPVEVEATFQIPFRPSRTEF